MAEGQTLSEKILSRVVGRPLAPGEVVYPEPDLVTVHDLYVVNFDRALKDLGVRRLHAPEKVLICTDHEPVALSVASALRQQAARKVVADYGIRLFYDVGQGGHGHLFPMLDGIVLPGQFVAGFDMHVANFGAIGALGIYFGFEISEVLACGSAWVRVPESIRVNLTGSLAPGVCYRDVSQYVTATLGEDLLDYRVVEYGGEAFARISIAGRTTLCNTPLESCAKSAIVEQDDLLAAWMHERGHSEFSPQRADAGAAYAHQVSLDISAIGPQIAAPPTSTSAASVSLFTGISIQHAFVGSCANGSIEDLRDAATILRGRKLAAGVRMVVTPGTQKIAQQAAEEGLYSIFIEAGAIVSAPGCGVCATGMLSPLVSGEVSINTGTVNHPGRLGATDAQIYLASPLTVAASAVAGKITDPRILLS